MAQLVAIFSPDTGTTQEYLQICIEAMQSTLGRPPRAVRRFSRCAIATFPRMSSSDESGLIHDLDEYQAWSVGIGTWICTDGADPESAARGLAAALRSPAKLPSRLDRIEGGFCFLTGSFDGERAQLVTDP